MTRSELIENIAKKNPNLLISEIEKIVNIIFSNITSSLAKDALIDMPSSDLDELNNAKSDEELAQIILEKTGRKKISIKENKDKSLKQFKKEDETAQKKDQNN